MAIPGSSLRLTWTALAAFGSAKTTRMTNTTRPKASARTHDFRRISHSPVVFVRPERMHPRRQKKGAEANILGRGVDEAYWSGHVIGTGGRVAEYAASLFEQKLKTGRMMGNAMTALGFATG